MGVIADYARSWSLLQGYDEQSLTGQTGTQQAMRPLNLDEVLAAIAQLKAELIAKGEATELFGQFRSGGLAFAARYHANAITTAEVLQELIQLAKDLRAARERGEANGMTLEEIAFYDALAENESAMEVMGDEQLRVIAEELLMSLRDNVTVDWAHRQSARARLRVLVKRILRKYGYPPDLQDAAVQTVLQQAEALTGLWQSA